MIQVQYKKVFLAFLWLGLISPLGAESGGETSPTESMPEHSISCATSEKNANIGGTLKSAPLTFQVKNLSDALNQAYVFSTQILASSIELKRVVQECFKTAAEWFPQVFINVNGQINPTSGFTTNNVGTVLNVVEDNYRTKQRNRSISANFQIVQNLYNGGETMAKNAMFLERYRQEFSSFKGVIQDTFLNVITKFVDMVCARERYLIFKMREESAAMLREIARNRAMAGDQRMVDVSVANAQSIRISMASNDAMQEYLTRKHELEVLTGSVMAENCEFPAPLEIDLYTLESFIELCLKSNPKVQAQMHALKVARLAVKMSAASFLPKINFELTGNASDQYSFNMNSGFTSYPVKNSVTGYTAAVTAQMNIFDGGARNAQYRQTELDVKKNRIIVEQQRREVIGMCKDLVNQYRLTLQNLVSAREAQKEQAAAFAAARQEYSLGATTLVDLLGLEEQYVNILNALINAQGQLVKLSYQLKAVAGKLTENTLSIQTKRYDIEKYRKEFPLPMAKLCPGEMTTELYEVSIPKGYIVGSEMKLETFNALAHMEPGLKETSIPWYPKDGIAIQEESNVSVEDADKQFNDLLRSYSNSNVNAIEDHVLESIVRSAKLMDVTPSNSAEKSLRSSDGSDPMMRTDQQVPVRSEPQS